MFTSHFKIYKRLTYQSSIISNFNQATLNPKLTSLPWFFSWIFHEFSLIFLWFFSLFLSEYFSGFAYWSRMSRGEKKIFYRLKSYFRWRFHSEQSKEKSRQVVTSFITISSEAALLSLTWKKLQQLERVACDLHMTDLSNMYTCSLWRTHDNLNKASSQATQDMHMIRKRLKVFPVSSWSNVSRPSIFVSLLYKPLQLE